MVGKCCDLGGLCCVGYCMLEWCMVLVVVLVVIDVGCCGCLLWNG